MTAFPPPATPALARLSLTSESGSNEAASPHLRLFPEPLGIASARFVSWSLRFDPTRLPELRLERSRDQNIVFTANVSRPVQ